MAERKITFLNNPGEEEDGDTATVPALPGWVTQGETLEEAIAMAKDAIQGYVESMLKDGEPIPEERATVGRTALYRFSQNSDGHPIVPPVLPREPVGGTLGSCAWARCAWKPSGKTMGTGLPNWWRCLAYWPTATLARRRVPGQRPWHSAVLPTG